jgi:hypothetical protein
MLRTWQTSTLASACKSSRIQDGYLTTESIWSIGLRRHRSNGSLMVCTNSVGLSAAPIIMMILGCNLSASLMQSRIIAVRERPPHLAQTDGFPLAQWWESSLASSSSCIYWNHVVLHSRTIRLGYSNEIEAAFYPVGIIVSLTPTVNNVMVMVELSGTTGITEGVATAIALQYAVAPFKQ